MSIPETRSEQSTDTLNYPVDNFFEVVDGQRITLPGMTPQEVRLANVLARHMWNSLGQPLPGEVFVEMLFQLDADGNRQRRPDVAYVPFERWPSRSVPEQQPWAMVPAVVAEVVSAGYRDTYLHAKIEDYLQHGVELLWIIYPRKRLVHVFEPVDHLHILTASDALHGGKHLQNFSLSLATLFEVLDEPEPAPTGLA